MATFAFFDAEPHWKDSLVVLAFPTAGSAAPIAAHYLLRRLKLPLVGHLRLDGLTGVTAVHDGLATSPVRIHGGDVECNLEGGCPRMYVILTELALPPQALVKVAAAVLDAAKDARMVLTLEAVARAAGDDSPDVFCAAATMPLVAELAAAAKVEPAARALLVGLTAEVLTQAEGRPAASLIVEARRDHPDGRAAAALIEALDRLIPHVSMDPGPLLEEALQLEKEIAQTQETATQGVRPGTFI